MKLKILLEHMAEEILHSGSSFERVSVCSYTRLDEFIYILMRKLVILSAVNWILLLALL